MGKRFAYFVMGFVVWIVLVYTLQYQEVIVGAGVALLTAAIFGRHLPLKPGKLLSPVRWFWLLVYIPVFVYMCLKANIDVALRVLSPGLLIKPGIVKIRTRLKSDIARVFLANSITLTPGTMTVEIKEDVLYIHWIEVGAGDMTAASKAIIGPFEYFLARIFD
ncbi:Na+/H+ antiporter subunit E [candidate division WOR-3 bacterium]|nr:Na+/H+ antiporter subunit E [candidate division WOR-3 bacterium]